MAKERLDVLLVNRGLAVSREKAKAVIMSGCVYVDGQKEDKAGSTFPEEAQIEVRVNTLKYVSLHADNTLIITEFPCKLSMSHIYSINLNRTILEHAVRKTAC